MTPLTPQACMCRALELAQQSAAEGEVPVGAVIVKDGQIVGEGRNRRETGKNALYHAEIEAIDSACKTLHGWRLWQCEMFVTLEPCPMCAGAILNARLRRVTFGAYDQNVGSFGSMADFNQLGYNHTVEVTGGFMEEDCASLLRSFFKTLRTRPKKRFGVDYGTQNNGTDSDPDTE